MQGRVLSVAGSDSSGGAGIQADIKTLTALGVYGATAITALTVQNTKGVDDVMPVDAAFVRNQISSVMDDIGADVIKTGMLLNADIINVVADALMSYGVMSVVDPVMVAKGGALLLEEQAVHTLTSRLLPCAALITPNIPEAEVLSGQIIKTPEDMQEVAVAMQARYKASVLLKGGHLSGDDLVDILALDGDVVVFRSKRLPTVHTHGTGCTYASAIAAYLSKGYNMVDAVDNARGFVVDAIAKAPGLGKGHGPLGHHLV